MREGGPTSFGLHAFTCCGPPTEKQWQNAKGVLRSRILIMPPGLGIARRGARSPVSGSRVVVLTPPRCSPPSRFQCAVAIAELRQQSVLVRPSARALSRHCSCFCDFLLIITLFVTPRLRLMLLRCCETRTANVFREYGVWAVLGSPGRAQPPASLARRFSTANIRGPWQERKHRYVCCRTRARYIDWVGKRLLVVSQ